MRNSLPPEALRWQVPANDLQFGDSRSVPPVEEIIGQEEALEALNFGATIAAPGFNIFVAGLEGGGRLQTLARMLEGLQAKRRVHRDLCFLARLHDPARPRLEIMRAGQGAELKEALANLRAALHDSLPLALESEGLRSRKNAQVLALEEGQSGLLFDLRQEMKAAGFAIAEGEEGGEPQVVFEGPEGPLGRSELMVMAEAELPGERTPASLLAELRAFEERLAGVMGSARTAARAAGRALAALEAEAVAATVRPLFAELEKRFRSLRSWLKELEGAVVRARASFLPRAPNEEPPEGFDPAVVAALQVNVVHGAKKGQGAPVIVGSDPTFATIFGGVVADGPPDHTRLRAGLLHDADGGFLVLDAEDVLSEPGVWKTLVRAMRFGEVGIQNLEGATQGAPAALRPDPIPLDVKIILVGPTELYAELHEKETDFSSIFKVLAEFHPEVAYRPELPRQLAGVVRRICERERLRAVSAGGMGAILESLRRLSGSGGKLRLDPGLVLDWIREAHHRGGADPIERAQILGAIAARERREGRAQAESKESLERGMVRVETAGQRVGEINGLSVMQLGAHRFGRPIRISVAAGPGRGLVDVERDVGLSGRFHAKGVRILQGFLLSRLGREEPLSLRASLVVEQSYAPVDGDSASLAELCALLSAISQVPLRQGRAVTGSIDQSGRTQPVGGVNEKIEGFFELCAARGLEGEQGVILPSANVADLMLAENVVDACASGKFHIWAVDAVEEALDLLVEGPGRGSVRVLLECSAALARFSRATRRGLRESSARSDAGEVQGQAPDRG